MDLFHNPMYLHQITVLDLAATPWFYHCFSIQSLGEVWDSVIYAETAAAVWTDLRERFSQGDAAKIYRIRRNMIMHHQQNQSPVSVYYTKLKSLWDELSSHLALPNCSCGAMKTITEMQQHERVMQFLQGLNDSFSVTRRNILLMDPPFFSWTPVAFH